MQAETDQGPVVGHSSGDKAGSSGLSPSAIEGMLLMAVEKLYKEDRELDVQMGLLRVVLQVLQRHGELCSSHQGWGGGGGGGGGARVVKQKY